MAKRVCVTGGAGAIAYSLVFAVARGDLYGPNTPVIIHLLDIVGKEKNMEGVQMELQDGAFPLLHGVVTTTSEKEAFSNVDIVLMTGAFPRLAGMERKDLLKKNCLIFATQGKTISDNASEGVKVVVIGNPANTNAYLAQNAYYTQKPQPYKHNFSALTRLDQNRAKALLARHLNVNVTQVHNVIIWGNHSSTQYPDLSHAFITDYPEKGKTTKAADLDLSAWNKEFIETVQKRGAKIIEYRGLSSAASAAKAIIDHAHDWIHGTPEGEFVSMGVVSDGSYGITEGLVFSFPVTIKNGQYTIVKDLPISEFSRKMLKATEEELLAEKVDAIAAEQELKK